MTAPDPHYPGGGRPTGPCWHWLDDDPAPPGFNLDTRPYAREGFAYHGDDVPCPDAKRKPAPPEDIPQF